MPTDDSKPFDSLHRESLQAIGKELEKHFPRTFEETELVLMEVSPRRLHAYWHITPWDLDAVLARTKHTQARLVMRFHDLSDVTDHQTPHSGFDLELTQTSGSQYVELWQDAKRYAAELGLRTADGKLLDLARSNTVELPRASQSPYAGSRVLTLTPLAQGLYEAPIDINQGGPGAGKRSQLWRENPDQPIDLTLLDSGLPLFSEFPDPLHDTAAMRRLWLPEFPRIQAIEIIPKRSDESVPGALLSPTELNGSVVPGQALLLGKEFPLSPIQELTWVESTGLTPGVATLPSPQVIWSAPFSLLPPWPDELPVYRPTGAPASSVAATATSFPGTPPQPVSSFALGPQEEAELHMELHIRGRKRPDGQFVLFGQPIPTDQDGRFSLTRILPPETQQIVAQLLAASRNE